MNESKKLTVQMTAGEAMAGWIYLPVYLLLLGLVLELVFQLLGLDSTSLQGRTNLNGAFFCTNFLACVLLFHRFLLNNLVMVGKRFWGFVQAVILGLAMYFAGTYLVNAVLLQLLPDLQNLNDAELLNMAQANRTVIVVGTVVLAPMAEECMFRGLIFRSIAKKHRILAYIVTTLVFSAVHVVGYIEGNSWQTLLGCLVQYLPACIALPWTYEKADSIFAPMVMHGIINAIAMGLML